MINIMIQRFILLLFLYLSLIILPFVQKSIITSIFPAAQATEENALKINSINFDNSDSIIFLGISSDNENQEINITKKNLTDPNRVYFDIENAITTFPNRTFELKNSRLKQVKIAQNSLSPNIVRIVIWSSDGYDTSQIKVLNIKNNIVIKLGSEKPLQQYLTQVYKETKESAIDYYDKAVVIAEGKNTEESDEIFNNVQKAFSIDGQELVRPNIEQKQARLKSRFFLENVSIRNGGVLLTGIGVVNLEKPFILTEPYRIVFDLPNTIVLQELRDKEFKISETASVKIGQFEPSKARIVIRSQDVGKFKPVYSTNLQTLFISNNDNLMGVSTTPIKTELLSFKERTVNNFINELNIIFTNPIIYSIKKDNNYLNITLYNLINFNHENFNLAAEKNSSGIKAKKIDLNTYILSIPTEINDLVDCYETLNASQLRFVLTKDIVQDKKSVQIEKTIPQNIKLSPIIEKQQKKKSKNIESKIDKKQKLLLEKLNSKTIVIDPGHGGNDTGAMRGEILEKDLTLEIAKKVQDCLRKKGLTNILMTRTTDKTLSLDDRVQIANINKAAIFVSIHINASVKSEINGLETHYYTENGYKLAKLMHKELIENVNAVDRGLFKSKFYVINHTEASAILLELGFISNENERKELISNERQTNSAEAIADGIYKFLLEHLNEK